MEHPGPIRADDGFRCRQDLAGQVPLAEFQAVPLKEKSRIKRLFVARPADAVVDPGIGTSSQPDPGPVRSEAKIDILPVGVESLVGTVQ